MSKKTNNNDLVDFVVNTLGEIDQEMDYTHNWHIELLCQYLFDVYKGKIKRLIVNIPPRNLKSVCVNVAFPAWVLAHNPAEKIISVSYSQALSLKHSTDCRKIMTSGWYQEYTETRISKGENEKKKFITNKNGYRFATSVGGTLTGEGGNLIILDDPQSPAKINSKLDREKTNKWFDSVLFSRLNDKYNGRIVLVMQRLHLDDLAGYLTSKSPNGWNVLSLSAEEENQEAVYYFNNIPYTIRKNQELLHESRENTTQIAQTKIELGKFTFQSQYQQKPFTEKGIIDISKLQYFENIHENLDIYYSIDTASSIKEENDYTIIMKIGILNDNFYILDIIRKKIIYSDLRKTLHEIINSATGVINILIENKNVGAALLSDIKASKNVFIHKINPTVNKVARVLNIINYIESKRIFVQKNAIWLSDFELEMANFPHVGHDDQVDALSQFLNHIKSYEKLILPKIPKMRSI